MRTICGYNTPMYFDIGSSYHCEAEFTKRWIVHPTMGNVSWVYTAVRQFSYILGLLKIRRCNGKI